MHRDGYRPAANSGTEIGQLPEHLYFTEHLLLSWNQTLNHIWGSVVSIWQIERCSLAGWCLLYALPAQLDVSACSKSSCHWTLDQLTRKKREYWHDGKFNILSLLNERHPALGSQEMRLTNQMNDNNDDNYDNKLLSVTQTSGVSNCETLLV